MSICNYTSFCHSPRRVCGIFKWSMTNLCLTDIQGANLNARTSEQMTPLHLAAWKGHLAALEYLLQHNAKVAASDFAMRTALHWSVSESHWDILQSLLKVKLPFYIIGYKMRCGGRRKWPTQRGFRGSLGPPPRFLNIL